MNVEASTEFMDFVESIPYLGEAEKSQLVDQSFEILTLQSTDPAELSTSVLVVGDVQSGKTLSFTSTMVLARSNGFDYVVVIAGTKRNLKSQTFERLHDDLPGLNWKIFESPNASREDKIVREIRDADKSLSKKVTPVFVVTKSPAGLIGARSIALAMNRYYGKEVNALLIDDEADQAGLNIAPNKPVEKSTFFASLELLRSSMGRHLFLLYTATSQALTVVDLADHMSPDHVLLLEPGPTYVGASELFGKDSIFPVEIPEDELVIATQATLNEPPVGSFREAFIYFLTCVALGDSLGLPAFSSMLVHPERFQSVHKAYVSWIKVMKEDLLVALDSAIASGDYSDLESTFNEAIRLINAKQQVSTGAGIPAVKFDEFVQKLQQILLDLQFFEVNASARGRDVLKTEWLDHKAWILIGGEKLGRGFTIENLLVTYMPRGLGMGMSDTVQQRGRFFGHKRHYVHFMRGWFSRQLTDGFRAIAEFERLYKISLAQVALGEESLRHWSREFIISRTLRLTRSPVFGMDLAAMTYKGGFIFSQRALFAPLVQDLISISKSHALVGILLQKSSLFQKDERVNAWKNRRVDITPLQAIDLLERWPMSAEESKLRRLLIPGLQQYATSFPNRNVAVIFMDSLQPRSRKATPAIAATTVNQILIDNLFQGRSSSRRSSYLGDREMRIDDAITIQIHNVEPYYSGLKGRAVLALAVSWPSEFDLVLIRQ